MPCHCQSEPGHSRIHLDFLKSHFNIYIFLHSFIRLFAREDGQKVVHIAGLRDVRVDSVSSLLEVCPFLIKTDSCPYCAVQSWCSD